MVFAPIWLLGQRVFIDIEFTVGSPVLFLPSSQAIVAVVQGTEKLYVLGCCYRVSAWARRVCQRAVELRGVHHCSNVSVVVME